MRYEEHPEDLNLADYALDTPLHFASLGGSVDIVRFLIETGNCEIDAENAEKETPLHNAVENMHVEVVKLLLDAGANPNLPNIEGDEALDLISYEDGDDTDQDDEDEYPQEDREKAREMRAAIIAAKQNSSRILMRHRHP
jgi:ankyrin repeat protein